MSAIQARMQLTAVPSKNDSSNDSELGTAAHVGGGGGKVSGAINGKVKWELFESQGDLVCSANMTGKIIADENSGIEFSALGFFRARSWQQSMAVDFGHRVQERNRVAYSTQRKNRDDVWYLRHVDIRA